MTCREEADDYPVVAQLSDGWRIIECRDGIQWILQCREGKRHGRPRWRARSYCRASAGLKRRVRELMGGTSALAAAILDGLPEWIEDGGPP